MSPYHWMLAILVVLTVLVFIWRYWKSSSPPSLPSPPPITTLQGMPPELRNIVYDFVAINTSMQGMRVVSGKKLVAAYEKLHVEHHTFKKIVYATLMRVLKFVAINTLLKVEERRPATYSERIAIYEHMDAKGHIVKLVRTNLKWYLGLMPMPNASVPVPAVDVTSFLPVATAPHPLNITSRQLRAEFQSFDEKTGGEYLFILNNFDLKQMGLIAASIHALDTEARARDPPVTLEFHVCFTFDRYAVSSARKLCSWIEFTNTVPLGLEYIAHKMTKIQVKTGLTEWQADRVYDMFWDLRRRTKGGDGATRPIRFVDSLFQSKVQVHRPRELGTWAPSEVMSLGVMARVSTS